MDLQQDLIIDGKYKLKKKLGEGGMGAVWLARHLGTGRPVALKLIVSRFTDNAEFVARFQREARAAGLLRHPNIVDVTDFGFAQTAEGRVAYLVMEYLEGAMLSAVIKEEKRLPLAWIADIFEQVCLAVDYAHGKGIVHRDLKPDNIWLVPNERGGFTIKVLDFGLARLDDQAETDFDDDETVMPSALAPLSLAAAVATGPAASDHATVLIEHSAPHRTLLNTAENATVKEIAPEAGFPFTPDKTAPDMPATDTPLMTRVGEIMGTPAYMAPEQCLGQTVGPAADIYSLGVIVYEMLAGRLPFEGTMLELIRQHLDAPPPTFKSLKAGVPKKVERVVRATLEKTAARRPPTAEALASMFRAACENPATLLQKSIVLYSQYFPKFLWASFLIGLPAFLIEGLLLLIDDFVPAVKTTYLDEALSFTRLVWSYLEVSLLLVLTMRLVAQFILSPLKPLSLRQAWVTVHKHGGALLLTAALVNSLALLGLLVAREVSWVILGLLAMALPVTMVEGVRGWAALRRALNLARRVWPTLLMATGIQFGLPLLVAWVTGLEAASLSGGHHWEARVERDVEDLIALGVGIVLAPLTTVLLSLVYLKARQVGGQPLADVLEPFESEEALYSDWQARLHSSLKFNSLTSRRNNTKGQSAAATRQTRA